MYQYLCQCPRFAGIRYSTLGRDLLPREILGSLEFKDILDFCRQTDKLLGEAGQGSRGDKSLIGLGPAPSGSSFIIIILFNNLRHFSRKTKVQKHRLPQMLTEKWAMAPNIKMGMTYLAIC